MDIGCELFGLLIIDQARDNKLTIEDMAGGTFTISNGGVFGSLMGTPIINVPQTGSFLYLFSSVGSLIY